MAYPDTTSFPSLLQFTTEANQRISTRGIMPQAIASRNIAEDTILAGNISPGTITYAEIAANTIIGNNVSALNLTGKTITADTGSIAGWTLGANELAGPAGAVIRSGQTDFAVGTGFWLGHAGGVPKFSIGTAGGNQMSWDGTNLRYTGDLTAASVLNTVNYTTAQLPQPATSAGFNSPAESET